MRAWNLIDELFENECKVSLISAKFDHSTKTHRIKNNNVKNYHKNLEIFLIDSPGYKNNISLSRLVDHIVLSWNYIFFKEI